VLTAHTPTWIVLAYLCPEDHQIPKEDTLSYAEERAQSHCAPPVDEKHIRRVLLHKFVQTITEEILRRQLLMFLSDNSFCGYKVIMYSYRPTRFNRYSPDRPTIPHLPSDIGHPASAFKLQHY